MSKIAYLIKSLITYDGHPILTLIIFHMSPPCQHIIQICNKHNQQEHFLSFFVKQFRQKRYPAENVDKNEHILFVVKSSFTYWLTKLRRNEDPADSPLSIELDTHQAGELFCLQACGKQLDLLQRLRKRPQWAPEVRAEPSVFVECDIIHSR